MELTSRREQAGFTLLEVLFAMVILGVGILSIALAQISSLKVSSKSRSLSQRRAGACCRVCETRSRRLRGRRPR